MTLYQKLHKQVSKLRLNRWKWYRDFRYIPIAFARRKPVLVNSAYYMYADDYDSLDILANRTYEPEGTKFFNSHLEKGTTAIDIGANTGYYSLLFAQKCDRVYAFEPERKSYDLLLKNIALNHMEDTVIPEKYALSDRRQMLELSTCKYNNGGNTVLPRIRDRFNPTFKYQEVEGIRLDDYFIRKRYPEYIKMDVEGYEPWVIKGGMDTFSHAKFIFFEDSSGETYPLIRSMGFNITELSVKGNFVAEKL